MIKFKAMASGTNDASRLIEEYASPEDTAGAASRNHPARQHDFLLTRAALRELLYEITGCDDWSFRADDFGKPLAFSAASAALGLAAPHISLSHTQGMIAVVVSTVHPVGIDIEKWRIRNFAALASYAFTAEEATQVASGGEAVFYRLWTLKEAQAKAMGIGVWATLEQNISTLSGWEIHYEEPCTGYSLSVATKT